MFVIAFYVPPADAEKVKKAMFDAGAGKIGNYQHCSWQIEGRGQFMPCEGANPHQGTIHQLERLNELKVEMVCENELIHGVIAALKQAHPFEMPGYHVIRCEDV